MRYGNIGKMNFIGIFNNKKVFITGHTGFKGSWLLSWLHLLGADIKGYALTSKNHSDIYNVINGNDLCSAVFADIRDKEKITKEILAFQPDYIFHLAAQPLVIESYSDPIYTFEVNTLGTANVLEALRNLAKPCVAVMITTDKVYQNSEIGQAYREEDRLGGYDPYSASKGAAEIIIDSYKQSFFKPAEYKKHHKSVSVARAGNVIGGGDWAKNRIIPDTVRALKEQKSIEIRNPNAIRPWQHVLEPLRGYLTLAAKQTEDPFLFADSFNFGPHLTDNLCVQEIVVESIKIWGTGDFIVSNFQNQLHEAGLLKLDITKAEKLLGWQPRIEAIEAIRKTIDWYKNYFSKNIDMFDFTRKQIIDSA
jgi:CDP-glucose 4,6-dehydratase